MTEIEKILYILSDMQEMTSPNDDLTAYILSITKKPDNSELSLDDLDLVSAAADQNIKQDDE